MVARLVRDGERLEELQEVDAAVAVGVDVGHELVERGFRHGRRERQRPKPTLELVDG